MQSAVCFGWSRGRNATHRTRRLARLGQYLCHWMGIPSRQDWPQEALRLGFRPDGLLLCHHHRSVYVGPLFFGNVHSCRSDGRYVTEAATAPNLVAGQRALIFSFFVRLQDMLDLR
jgi:hypothetical protein